MEEDIETLIKRWGVNPKNIDTWGKKGIALFHLKEYEKATEFFDKSLEADPKNIGILFIKAFAFYKLKKLKKQKECLSALLLIKPEDEFDWCNLGIAIAILEHSEKRALECFNEALKINPKDISSWDNKAFALYGLGRFKEAIGCFDEILKIDPKNESAWGHKGEVLAQGYSLKGGKKFKGGRRVEGPKEFVDAWLDWKPKYKEAIRCYNKVLEINPKNIHAWREKGLILEDYLGKSEGAIKCYDEILKIDSKNVEALSLKASVLKDIGRKFSASLFSATKKERAEIWAKILKKFEDRNNLWISFRGELFFDDKRYREEKFKEAIKCYDKILEIDPKNVDALLSKADALDEIIRESFTSQLGHATESERVWLLKGFEKKYCGVVECYDRILEIDPKNTEAWLSKGNLFDKLEKYADAVKCYKEALGCIDKRLAIDPDSLSNWELRGVILEALGRKTEAKKCFEKGMNEEKNTELSHGRN